ncbi:PTS glucitol/sorbitol transporter subunit IIC [Lichenicoccus sp.]|uniref:PTS glucitol/sorbitol transporter subunit IIC n=1 Tax=Lichenicoccus sp. TaxID=2781899 RepID=UPI003D0F61E0
MLMLSHLATGFIGVFNEGGRTFVAFATGILPTLIVLLTAVYALIELIGEHRVHRLARFAGRYAITRYTLLPVLAMFFLTNPMAYTFGVFIEERHKPAFYDSAVSFCHPITGLFPHANSSELFVWLGVAHGLMRLHLPLGPLAVRYFIAGLVVILLRGIVTERITMFLARRQGAALVTAQT